MNENDRRDLIDTLVEPLRHAETYLAAIHAAAPGDPLLPVSVSLQAGQEEKRKQTLADLTSRLRVIERISDENLHATAHAAIDDADDQVVELLAIWCSLYLNGTPKPNLWQTILNIIERHGSWPTSALTFKLYGDTYRIERRHWVELQRHDPVAADISTGIVSVAEYPMAALDDEAEKLSDETSLGAGPADGKWLSAMTLEDHLKAIAMKNTQGVRSLLYAVTERLARSYSALQVMAYLRSGAPMRMIWRDAARSFVPPQVRTLLESRLGPRQRMIKASNDDHADLKKLPFCVLSSVNFGVVRDPGQLLWSSTGRSELSGRHIRYRTAVLACFDSLYGDASAHNVVRLGRSSGVESV